MVPDKAQRVQHFHHHTLEALKELLEASGISSPHDISPRHIMRRVGATECRPLSDLYPALSAGCLVDARPIDLAMGGALFERHWHSARADSWASVA